MPISTASGQEKRDELRKRLEKALIGATPSQSEELRAAHDYFASDTNLPADLAIRSFDRTADAIKNVDELQKRLEKALIGATPSQSEELTAAHNYFASDTNLPADRAIDSFDRAADAIKNGIRVFISYKYQHDVLAAKLQFFIREYAHSRLARDKDNQPYVFLGEQGMEAGREYPEQIRKEIENAHWFLLLLPDVQSGRGWLIWEAGYFQRGMTASERLISIRHKQITGAAELQSLQAYDSSPDGLERLFTQLFFEAQAIPGMKQIAFDDKKQTLKRDTEELSRLFPGMLVPMPEVVGRYIDIKHSLGTIYDKMDDLLATQILEFNRVEEVFERDNTFHGTFAELIKDVNNDEHGRQWIEGLRAALQDIVAHHSPREAVTPFLGADTEWMFRPSVHCVWKIPGDGHIDRFRVIFVEEMGRRVKNVPPGLDTLETALRWAYRSWWEIYGTFAGHLTREDVDDIYWYTQQAEQEAQLKGVQQPEVLPRVFKEPEATVLRENQTKYYGDYRKPEKQDGKLDKAFRERNPALMRECLDELKPMSLWFLKAAARRFSELIADIQ